jgi:S-adenosylmethionine hydrolase
VKIEIPKPETVNSAEIVAEIIHIDRFGNLVTNLKKENLHGKFILQVNGTAVENHHKHYAEAGKSEVFSIWGSAGFLEIVAFRDSAKDLLNVKIGDKVFVTATGD